MDGAAKGFPPGWMVMCSIGRVRGEAWQSVVRRGCGNFSTNSYVAFKMDHKARQNQKPAYLSSASIVAVCCRQLAILVTAIELGKLSSLLSLL
eukprot:scaffold3587_cov151-Skeletonema_marinoi.AAC.3